MSMANITQKMKTKIPVLGKIKKPKSKKTVILIAALVILLVASVIVTVKLTGGKETEKILTTKVSRGNVTKVIEGSGTIKAIDQYEITALVTGEILKDHFAEGQEVKEGDLLYEIDTADIENSIEKSRASLEKSRLSYDQSRETVTNLTVRAPITGTVQEVYIENGDNVSNNGKVASIINSDYMRLKINFNAPDAKNITAGQTAQVYLDSSSTPISGEVESISTGSLINESGAPVSMAQIIVANPGAIKPGDSATAVVGDYACNDAGTFEYYDSAVVNAKSSGEAYNLRVKAGDKITAGEAIVYLESSSASVNARQSELSLKDSQLALDNLIEQRDDYNIKAPISGKVIQKNSKAGDNLTSSDRSTTMAIIADLSSLVFEISVDELDISSIKVGQTVTVTADALENRMFIGHVDNVSIVGSSSNGVTSYPVKVVMDDGIDSGLIPGMNVNASIVIDSRTDVLRVPVSAVQRGNIVYVKNGSDSAKGVTKVSAAPAETGETTQTTEQTQGTPRQRGGRPSGERPNFQRGERPQSQGDTKTAEGTSKTTAEGTTPADNSGVKVTVKDGSEESKEPQTTPQGEAQKENSEPKVNSGEGENKGNTPDRSQRGNMNSDRAAAMEARNQRLLESAQQNAPDGFTAVVVQVGLSDDSFTEIISGLNEGDEVYLPDKTASNARSTSFGGMGGFGGGMPMGGMGGANRGGNANRAGNNFRR